ncbi:MAG: class I SAM-dependent methyltransferase [Chloroflexi bacterium]|nr:class I SAM-dependent methyltransferase [Chloroflexota bacterium]
MRDADKKPIAHDTWQALAERYAARIGSKPENAYYERPATLSLLPDVKGKRVLDAGCGPGVYAEWLVEHGAEVLALDASPKMVELARLRLGARAQVRQADLEKPLDFLEDGSFDIVLSPLVLDYIKDWNTLFRQLYRVLRDPGLFVFSAGHPFAEYNLRSVQKSYFATELVHTVWRGFGEPISVPSYRRPLSAMVSALTQAGFLIEQMVEPLPTQEFKEQDPEGYEQLSKRPGFLCVRAVKRGR